MIKEFTKRDHCLPPAPGLTLVAKQHRGALDLSVVGGHVERRVALRVG